MIYSIPFLNPAHCSNCIVSSTLIWETFTFSLICISQQHLSNYIKHGWLIIWFQLFHCFYFVIINDMSRKLIPTNLLGNVILTILRRIIQTCFFFFIFATSQAKFKINNPSIQDLRYLRFEHLLIGWHVVISFLVVRENHVTVLTTSINV